MKNKKYIMDNDNKVRNCISNIIKMNPFEYCYYNIFYWNFYQIIFLNLLSYLKEFFMNLYYFIATIIITILYTLFMPVYAYFEIKREKEMIQNNKN